MSGWTKLFSSIVTSSVWCEDYATRLVWVAMLSQADADGVVEGSVPGFANIARVTVDEMRAAVAKLSAPDPDSRTQDHEGRRIEAIEGGWLVLNYAAYRERGQEKDGSRAPYYREYRKRKKAQVGKAARDSATPSATFDVARNTEERGEKRETEDRENERSLPADPKKPPNGDGDLTETERKAYANEVWTEFLRVSGQRHTRVMGPGEWSTVNGWMNAGVPLRIALRGIADTTGKGSTLSYYGPSVTAAYEQWRKAVPL